MSTFWNDLRISLRSLSRRGSIGFTLVTVLTVSLGIGATSAVLSLVKAAILDALPFPEPDRLVFLRGQQEREGAREEWPLGYADIESLGAESSTLERVASVTGARPFNLAADGKVEHVNGELTSAEYFRVYGVGTRLGRVFTKEETLPATATRVVVLADDFWQARFGSDPSIVGRTIELNEQPYVVIGVAAAGFRGTSGEAHLWMPIGLSSSLYGAHYTEMRMFRWLSGVARMRAGVTPERLKQDLALVSSRLAAQFPTENKGLSYDAQLLQDAYYGSLRRPLLSLLAGAGFVLLIACTNVANLLLARAAARRRELAVRVALGATPWRLVRQQLGEGLLLVTVGAGIGLLLAHACIRLLVSSGLVDLGSYASPSIDPWVVAIAVGLAFVSAVTFTTAPVVFASRVAPAEGLGEGGRAGTVGVKRSRFHWTLVVGEVALAMTLLAGAGLLIKGFRHLISRELGFSSEQLLTLRLDLTAARFQQNDPVWSLTRSVLDRVGAVPGVTSAAVEGPGLPTSGFYAAHFTRDDVASSPGSDHMVRRHHVSPSYFGTLGIALRTGRLLGSEDVSTSPRSIVISESVAQRVWPNESPVGKRLRPVGANAVPYTVVGVVADVEHSGRNPEASRFGDVYLSVFQSPPRSPAVMNVVVRTSLPPERAIASVRAALAEAAPGLPPYDIRTMADRLHAQTSSARLLVFLLGAFATLALVLAMVGVYGVLAYLVTQRTREIGIRAALGAARGQLVWHVVREGLRPIVLGVAIGLVAALGLTRLLTAMLYGVSPTDPVTLLMTAGMLLAIGVVACAIPALRAQRVDPLVALRAD